MKEEIIRILNEHRFMDSNENGYEQQQFIFVDEFESIADKIVELINDSDRNKDE